jgi:hypothetical protein
MALTNILSNQGKTNTSTNYITNNGADSGTTGWATYNNTAGAAPVTGTGGSPVVTFATSVDTTMRGAANFLFTKGAANRQGDGFSYDFTIDGSDTAKVLQCSLEYKIASGTYADNDITFWIYDKTNSVLIQPAPTQLKNSGIIERFAFEFQAASNSTSYRLIGHVSSVSAAAYSLRFDSFNLSNQAKLYGSAVTDSIAYTPTFTGLGTPLVNTATWERHGSKALIQFAVQAGIVSGVSVTMTLPPGLVADFSKIQFQGLGSFAASNVTTTPYSGNITAVSPSSTTVMLSLAGVSNWQSGHLGTSFINTGLMSGSFLVPIVGWSSSQVMSSDADTRVVYANFTGTRGSTSTLDIVPLTVTNDSHGATSGNIYTVKVPGYYEIDFSANTYTGNSAVNDRVSHIYIDGVSYANAGSSSSYGASVPVKAGLVLRAGQTISFYAQSASIAGTLQSARASIKMATGPSQIMASESVVAVYTDSSGQVYPATTTYNAVTFNTKEKDSHNAFNGATGVFTAPMSGQYSVTMSVSAYNSLAAGGAYQDLRLETNGISAGITNRQNNTAASQIVTQMVTKTFSLLAGQIVTATKGATYSVGTYVVFASTSWNSISITRTGQY